MEDAAAATVCGSAQDHTGTSVCGASSRTLSPVGPNHLSFAGLGSEWLQMPVAGSVGFNGGQSWPPVPKASPKHLGSPGTETLAVTVVGRPGLLQRA